MVPRGAVAGLTLDTSFVAVFICMASDYKNESRNTTGRGDKREKASKPCREHTQIVCPFASLNSAHDSFGSSFSSYSQSKAPNSSRFERKHQHSSIAHNRERTDETEDTTKR